MKGFAADVTHKIGQRTTQSTAIRRRAEFIVCQAAICKQKGKESSGVLKISIVTTRGMEIQKQKSFTLRLFLLLLL